MEQAKALVSEQLRLREALDTILKEWTGQSSADSIDEVLVMGVCT